MPETSGRAAVRWVQFTVGGEGYALPVETVAQIVGLDELRPAGQPGWAGLLQLKGRLLPLADGAALLGESNAGQGLGRGLVIRGRLPLGFTVEAVVGLAAGAAQPLTSRLGLPDLVSAALPVGDATYLVLDAEALWQRLRSGLQQMPGGAGYRLLPLGGGTVAAVAPAPLPALPNPPAPPLVAAKVGRGTPFGGLRSFTQPSGADVSARLPAPPVEPFKAPQVRSSALQPPELNLPTAEAPATVVQAVAPPPLATAVPSTPPQTVPTAGPTDFPGGTVLMFRAGPEANLAVPLDQVLEIGPAQQPAPVHGGADQIVGVLNFHGRLVPLVDLPARLGYELTGPRQTLYLRLIGHAAEVVAVSIGELTGQANVPALTTPTSELGLPIGWVRGVARIGQRPLIILDTSALVAS